MNIMIINGSHRNGNTSSFVDAAERIFEEQGHIVSKLGLLEKRFDICNGCLICEETGECIIHDLFTDEVIPMIKEVDALVFSTPVYFNSVPALLKNFIDRTNCLCDYFEEHRKKVAFFLVGQLEQEEGSADFALRYLKEYAEIMNFDLSDRCICETAREAGSMDISEEMKKIIASWFE